VQCETKGDSSGLRWVDTSQQKNCLYGTCGNGVFAWLNMEMREDCESREICGIRKEHDVELLMQIEHKMLRRNYREERMLVWEHDSKPNVTCLMWKGE
jgi:hypothetical protein